MGLLDGSPDDTPTTRDPFDDVNHRIMTGNGARFFSWEKAGLGGLVTGTLVDAKYRQQTYEGKVLTFADGTPREELVLTLATALRDEPDDDGHRQVAVRYDIERKLRDLLKAKGAKLERGGTFAMKWVSGAGSAKAPRQFDIDYAPAGATTAAPTPAPAPSSLV